MIAAEPVAELLPQEFLRIPAARIVAPGYGRIASRDPFRRGFGLRDESFLAHAREDDVATLDGAVEFDHGESADGARASPAMSVHLGNVN